MPLLPWSARHSHRSSPTTLSLLICSVCVALPTVAPPMRANTSDRTVGSDAWLALEPGGPIWTRTGLLVTSATSAPGYRGVNRAGGRYVTQSVRRRAALPSAVRAGAGMTAATARAG